MFMMFGINAIVTYHFEMLVRDMNDQAFDKVNGRDAFGNRFVIFMPLIMKSNQFTIIGIDSGSGNHRAAQISADVFNCNIGRAEVWLSPDIKAMEWSDIVNIHEGDKSSGHRQQKIDIYYTFIGEVGATQLVAQLELKGKAA